MKPSEVQINPEQFINAILLAVVGDGLVPQGKYDFVRERGDKKLIVVTAAPRSGSTYLANVLVTLTGFPYERLCAAYSTNEHDLSLPELLTWNRVGCVSQLHMKGTFHNAALLRTFGIKPIILVRGIFDIVTSLMDDLRLKEKLPDFGTGLDGYSFIWQDDTIRQCPDHRLLDVIIDLVVPWYVNFYVSWFRLCEQGAVEAKWVTYEAMMSDKRGTLEDILNFVGARNISSTTEDALALRADTYNVGGSGRGDKTLSTPQKERIKHLFSYYPDVDFGKYGLGRGQ